MANYFLKAREYCGRLKYKIKRFSPWIFRPSRMIFLFGSPGHSNLGDQAQTYCIEKWLKKNYPNYGIRIFTLRTATNEIFTDLRRFIRKHDMLVCHSGYHFTDLYRECDPYKKLATMFPDYRITIFPQTVYYKEHAVLEETARIFNNHGNTLLMCRDEVSYNTAKEYFTNCHLLLMPDIVTSLIGTVHFNSERKGILFCIRNDKEAFYSKEDIQQLRSRFVGGKTDMTDTTLPMSWQEIAANREQVILQEIEKYSKYQVLITDRYHGTIFSLIAGTPVIVIGSNDHKLSSGVNWFPEEFRDYVTFAHNLEEAYIKATQILSRDDLTYQLPPYFRDNYYSGLKQLLQ
ncbi:MAG: polysaccharide pyruvyl transferase family protein [Bacteroidales bacterium]|nr:polysaccharide pyruvyl transferase family protein [Bacteroidales bacterium]